MKDKARKLEKDALLEKFITSGELTRKFKKEFFMAQDEKDNIVGGEHDTFDFYDCQLTPKDPSEVFKIDKEGRNTWPQFRTFSKTVA